MFDFVAIDFETANDNSNSACSVGIVAVNDLEIAKKDYFLIKPPTNNFNPKNTLIHGLTFEDVKQSPEFPVVFDTILWYIQNSHYLVAHNAQFDMSVLFFCAKEYGLDVPDFSYIDSINFSSKTRKGKTNSLEACAEAFDIKLTNHHNSLADAEVCALLMIASVNCSRYRTFHTYLTGYSSIKVKKYSDLKPNAGFVRGKRPRTTTKISDIKPKTIVRKTNQPFYGKSIVFTGALEQLERETAMQMAVDSGAVVKSIVSSRTDYVVVGIQDQSIVGPDGMSTKERKAHELIEQGYNIRILTEEEFLKIIRLSSESENHEYLYTKWGVYIMPETYTIQVSYGPRNDLKPAKL